LVDQVCKDGEPADPVRKHVVHYEHECDVVVGKTRDEHGRPQWGIPGQRRRDD
jgi:hypothetical protein